MNNSLLLTVEFTTHLETSNGNAPSMQFFLTTAGLQVAWWTSVLPYLSSKRQRLLVRPISRALGSTGFLIGMVTACWLLARVHHPVSAITYWLSVVMVSWGLLVLSVPHFERRSHALVWGAGIMLLAAMLG